ncbi:MAG TPA: sensor histidine kinase [Trebonia sp.]|nr:sensor histidine kinase [Trebonia sp.]
MVKMSPLPRAPALWPPTGRSLTDAAIAVAVTGLSLTGSAAAASWHHDEPSMNITAILLLIAAGLSLTARRRYPAAVLGVTMVAALVSESAGHARMAWLPVIVAFFAAVRARRRVAVLTSLVIGYLVAVWPPWLIGGRGHASAASALGLLCGLLVLLSVAELLRAATERRLAAQRIREQERLRLASEERMRIARDLHDVVAHNISVINVQANTALHLADREPERAKQALATINDVSRQALTELRSVLGILRADGEVAPRAPAPGPGLGVGLGLDGLATLVSNMSAAGLEVLLETEGSPGLLPESVDLAAYRIIQEALTNSARHSGAARATVRLRYRATELEVEVEDEGTGDPKPSGLAGTGSGIIGMTDRAQALGGHLTAGPRPGGGFLVTAVLPTPSADRGDR